MWLGLYYWISLCCDLNSFAETLVGCCGRHELGKIWDWNGTGQEWIFCLDVNLALELAKE